MKLQRAVIKGREFLFRAFHNETNPAYSFPIYWPSPNVRTTLSERIGVQWFGWVLEGVA